MNSAPLLVWTDQTPAAKLNYECEESSETESSQVKSNPRTTLPRVVPIPVGFRTCEWSRRRHGTYMVASSHFWTARGAIPSTKTEGSYA